MDRFRYQVTPFQPINNLIPGKSLRRPFSSDLTKEEVLLCMKCGPVFRVVSGSTPIRVTGSNLDQLHRENITEKESEIKEESNTTVIAENAPIQDTVVVEEPKIEAPTEVVPEENDVVEEVTPSEEPVEEVIEDAIREEVVEETEEEKQEEEKKENNGVIEIPMGLNISNNNNPNARPQQNYYNGKKNKHHNNNNRYNN